MLIGAVPDRQPTDIVNIQTQQTIIIIIEHKNNTNNRSVDVKDLS